MLLVSVTLDMSHSPISPCGPLEQSPFADSSRHALTVPLSSVLDCGENAAMAWGRTVWLSLKVGKGRTEGWQREGQPLYGIRQGLCDAEIWDAHLRTNHCKNAAKCRQGALGTGTKDTKVNESVHFGVLLCFCLCCVFLCLSA